MPVTLLFNHHRINGHCADDYNQWIRIVLNLKRDSRHGIVRRFATIVVRITHLEMVAKVFIVSVKSVVVTDGYCMRHVSPLLFIIRAASTPPTAQRTSAMTSLPSTLPMMVSNLSYSFTMAGYSDVKITSAIASSISGIVLNIDLPFSIHQRTRLAHDPT